MRSFLRLLIVGVTISSSLISCSSSNKATESELKELNLGFEIKDPNNQPHGWYAGGGTPTRQSGRDFVPSMDTAILHSGSYALKMVWKGGKEGVAKNEIPNIEPFRGKNVTYRGWVRTEDLEYFANLWMNVFGPGNKLLQSTSDDGMMIGSTDWSLIEHKLFVDSTVTAIHFGMTVQGRGEAWVDDLSIEIDDDEYAP